MAQDGHPRSADGVFLGVEDAADPRFDAERGEDVGGNHGGANLLGRIAAGQIETVAAVHRHLVQRLDLRAPVQVVRIADGHGSEVRIGLPVDQDLLGLRVRQRAQQGGVDDAEDGRVHADPQGDGEQRDGREARVLGEHAAGIANVGDQ